MKPKKPTSVTINPDALLDELMWPAARYCIGRHTYVSSYAKNYWNIIRKYRHCFNESRLQFFARDIKDNIANAMRFWKNLDIEGAGNDRIKYDPYFLLCRYLYEHPDTDFASTDFDIDCISGEVETRERETPLTDSEIVFARVPDYDLEEWSKLASCIADTRIVRAGGEEHEVIETYEEVRYSYDEPLHWEKYIRPVEQWNGYIPKEMIEK